MPHGDKEGLGTSSTAYPAQARRIEPHWTSGGEPGCFGSSGECRWPFNGHIRADLRAEFGPTSPRNAVQNDGLCARSAYERTLVALGYAYASASGSGLRREAQRSLVWSIAQTGYCNK